MSKDGGFLGGLLWGAAMGGKSKGAIEIEQINARTDAMLRARPALQRMHDSAESFQQYAYVETTKLAARVATEKELLSQLEDAGLSDDSRIPLADIEKFEETYLINLFKARQDLSVIDNLYPNGMPYEIKDDMNETQIDIGKRLVKKGYDLNQIGIKL